MITGSDVEIDRKRRGLSRGKYAELVGLTPTKVANIEHGRAIRPEELEVLLRYVKPELAERFDTASASDTTWVEAPAFLTDSEPVYLLTDEEVDRYLVEVGPPVAPVTSPALTSLAGPSPVQPTLPESPEPLVPVDARCVSNSELQTYKHCRRRWWLGWQRGLKLRDEPLTGPRQLGTRVHEALAMYYVPDGEPRVDPRTALEQVIQEDETAFVASLNGRDVDYAATQVVEFQREADTTRAMLEGYIEWLAETGMDQGYRVIGPEQVLAAPLQVTLRDGSVMTVYLIGRLDVRLWREHDDVVLFLDHKTVDGFSQAVRLLVFDEQMKMYRLLEELSRTPEDPPVAGALYNMLRKVKRTASAKPPFFERVEVRHNRTELETFTRRLRGEVADLLQTEDELRRGVDHHAVVYPSPSRDCLWKCEFTAICPMFDDGSHVERFIEEQYVEVNPLQRYEPELAVHVRP